MATIKQKKAKRIVEAIRYTLDSLESHLDGTFEDLTDAQKKVKETHKFHRKCVREYAFVALVLTEQLEEL